MQILGNNKILALVLGWSGVAGATELDLLYGHYEIQTDYKPGEGWWFGNSYNNNSDFNDRTQIRRLEADATRIVAPPAARNTITPAVSFIGAVGQPLWLLPQNSQLGNHFLGMRIIVDPLIFQSRVGNNYANQGTGSVSMRLVSVTGSGPERGGKFALWENDPFGGAVVYFNSNDGITAADEIPTLAPNAHRHLNWGFTRPGEYRVELEVYGRLRPAGQLTSTRQTFTFIIPHRGNLASFAAELCHQDGRWALAAGNSAAGVAFGERRVFIEALEAAPQGGWQTTFTVGADGWAVPDHAGLHAALASRGAAIDFPGDLALRLVGHIGPGEIDGVFDSSDGLDSADQLDLSAGSVSGTIRFTEKGIHTLFFRPVVAGMPTGSPIPVRFGAGLPVTYSFAEWADSYERAHGLPAGTLTDPAGDNDSDGLTHSLEYLLDAAGADPSGGGSVTHAEIEPGGTHARMVFLRDLHKDPLTGTGFQLHAGASDQLGTWSYLSPQNPGLPLEFFETDAEEGNARSLLMMRALRREIPAAGRGFFRLRDH